MNENRTNIHIQLDERWQLSLAVECPSCKKLQRMSLVNIHTGEEFVCDCGEDIPLSTEALYPVRKELEEIRHLANKSIALSV